MAVYAETIRGWRRLGNRGAIANQLENVAFVAIERGDAARAARLLGAAEALREASASPMTVNEEGEYAARVSRLRESAPVADVDGAWREGRIMTPTDAAFLATAP
jgi:hypothetical protein